MLTVFLYGGMAPLFLRPWSFMQPVLAAVALWWATLVVLAGRAPRGSGERVGEDVRLAYPMTVRVVGAFIAPAFIPIAGAALPRLYGDRGTAAFLAGLALFVVATAVVWKGQSENWLVGEHGIQEVKSTTAVARTLAWVDVRTITAPNGRSLVLHGPGGPLTVPMVVDGLADLARAARLHLPAQARQSAPEVMVLLDGLAAGRWTRA